MSKQNRIRNTLFAAVATASASLALAGTAGAVDLRDWGRKVNSASERFVVLPSFNSEAVLDKETQLVWQRRAAGATGWHHAVEVCYSSGTGGRQGWRLPSMSELSSLVGAGGVLPTGHPFLNVPNQIYFWSSTDRPYNIGEAFVKMLTGSSMSARNKTLSSLPYLCVRGAGAERR